MRNELNKQNSLNKQKPNRCERALNAVDEISRNDYAAEK